MVIGKEKEKNKLFQCEDKKDLIRDWLMQLTIITEPIYSPIIDDMGGEKL